MSAFYFGLQLLLVVEVVVMVWGGGALQQVPSVLPKITALRRDPAAAQPRRFGQSRWTRLWRFSIDRRGDAGTRAETSHGVQALPSRRAAVLHTSSKPSRIKASKVIA